MMHDLPDTLGIDDLDVIDEETVVACEENFQRSLLSEEKRLYERVFC